MIQQKKGVPKYVTKVSETKFSPIFDPKQIEKVASVERDLSALEESLSFEEKSIKYYQNLFEEAKNPKVKRFFSSGSGRMGSLSIYFDSIEFLKELLVYF